MGNRTVTPPASRLAPVTPPRPTARSPAATDPGATGAGSGGAGKVSVYAVGCEVVRASVPGVTPTTSIGSAVLGVTLVALELAVDAPWPGPGRATADQISNRSAPPLRATSAVTI